jgi:hypothetical protein
MKKSQQMTNMITKKYDLLDAISIISELSGYKRFNINYIEGFKCHIDAFDNNIN